MADVTLRVVSKMFGRGRRAVSAVDRVTLEVADREFVVLLGPSGCGKTTTLRIVAGLESPTGGSVSIGGRVVDDVSPKDRDVALVFQSFALYPHMTVAANLGFGLKMRGTPKVEINRRVSDVADMLGIADLLDRRPDGLSGGQQQRVALGRAVIRRPAVYLFDEPLANLDAPLRVQMRQKIKRMHREFGMTAIYVTHDQQEAMSLADRIAVMRNGRIEQIGRPQEVYRRPANRFVAGFVGSPPMSFLDVRIRRSGGEVSVLLGDCCWPLPKGMADGLAGGSDEPLVMGVRPESVRLSFENNDEGRLLPMQVEMVELVGDRCDVHGRLPTGQLLVARAGAADGIEEGAHVWAIFDMDGVTFFERSECGRNVMPEVVGAGERVS